ncbi:unnamed protein product [Clonostachys rosea f. rosea IK726]|uniref:Uncharacterized protein n=1 Tax=Clonostachys rosea f. rosea IK726 TaxID=1349383 RepID=A0ACA9TLJ2_BIOOC|nr:unnamed protein product [Clonostachys rosea f. rosea IK726]
MSHDESHIQSGRSPTNDTLDPTQRPPTARRVSAEDFSAIQLPALVDDLPAAKAGPSPLRTRHDNSALSLAPPMDLKHEDTSSSVASVDREQEDGGAMVGKKSFDHLDESYLAAEPIEPSRLPDDSLTEEAVREHLRDVESSFLPALSPVPAGKRSIAGGIDDTFAFDSPVKTDMPPRGATPETHPIDASNTTSNLEVLDSSPTAAAAARTISRAVSSVSQKQSQFQTRTEHFEPTTIQENGPDDEDVTGAGEGNESSHASASGDQESSLSRSHSLSDRRDAAGSNLSGSLRVKKGKYLRSRYASQRSSTSSFATNAESIDGSEITAMGAADYALQSGGAVPALGPSSRNSTNMFTRSISVGSAISGFDDVTDPFVGQLEPLPEINSPVRQTHDEDLAKTPKASKENLNTAPTDTVIARHVRNVQVPESLAKKYQVRGGLETPRQTSSNVISSLGLSTVGTGRNGKSLTLKEQSSTIERLSKENFDLKLKVMFLSDRLDKLSEEGIKEMISENVDLKTNLAILQRDNKVLRKRVKELEKQMKDEDERPSTARSGTSSTDQTAKMYDEDAQEREEELFFLRERVEEYATEIERLRNENMASDYEKRKLTEVVMTLGDDRGEGLGRQEEADVWKDLLEQETARREQADDDNRRLRDELFRLKQEISGNGGLHHTTNIYNITKKHREQNGSLSRPMSRHSADTMEMGSAANLSAGTTLVDELRKEADQLRHENAELRREVGAQTSMLTSRNREKERLYQEIEDLKMAQRHGRPAPSTVDSLLDRSASRIRGHERSHSRSSAARTLMTTDEEVERERDELETKLNEARDKLSEVKLQNQELQRELETCMEDFEAAVLGKREAEDTLGALQEELENAMNDLVALQSERDDALREQAEMENEFEALRMEAQEEIDTLEAEADQRNEELQRVQIDLADRSENFEALQEEMRKMSDALVGLEDEQENKLRRIQQLEQELESGNKELEELEAKLLESNEKNQRLAVQQESSQAEIAFLREEQEGDKIRIGDLEAAVANLEQSIRDEKERARELDGRLVEERRQSEIVANKEKEDVQQIINQLNMETSQAKDESRRLRKSLSSREVEATEWKERLIELENNLREALGDLNGTRSSLLKSIAKMQRELENTVRELDTAKADVNEKDRIIKQRDSLLESHALESRKLSELLEKERISHRNTKAHFDTYQKTNQHLSRTAGAQDDRIAELETTRSTDRRKIAVLEQQMRAQLAERNQLLLTLWQRLSALCGREWSNSNTLIDRQVLPSLEVIGNRLPGFSKNLLAAVKAIETIVGSFQTKIKAVERDLTREYQSLEDTLDIRTKKLDRLETMVRNTVATVSNSTDVNVRMIRLEDRCRQLKVENATLKAAADVRSRAAYSAVGTNPEALIPTGDEVGSPSPRIPRGPLDRDRYSSSGMLRPGTGVDSRSQTATSGTELALASEGGGGGNNNDNRWLYRLRDMEDKLKMEREARNQDRRAARQRLGGLESENKELRERMRRNMADE